MIGTHRVVNIENYRRESDAKSAKDPVAILAYLVVGGICLYFWAWGVVHFVNILRNL